MSLRQYRNPNNDPRGDWRTVPLDAQAGHDRRAPSQKRTRAVLACGHAVMLGGAPESWYGLAAPCPTCGHDVNVTSTEPASP
jgi:hypothetical protein